ncbi:hypothetical protein GCM10020001_119240 [Nonomuraea salmonea]
MAAALADIAAVIDPMERFARAGAGLAFHEACAAELRQMREEMAARFNRGDYGPPPQLRRHRRPAATGPVTRPGAAARGAGAAAASTQRPRPHPTPARDARHQPTPVSTK